MAPSSTPRSRNHPFRWNKYAECHLYAIQYELLYTDGNGTTRGEQGDSGRNLAESSRDLLRDAAVGNPTDATASVPGTFVYTPAAGAILPVGTDTLSVTFTPTDPASYTTVTQTATIVVGKATLTVTAANASRIYGAANPTFTATATGAVNGDTFTLTASSAATTSSIAGTYPIVPLATGANLPATTWSTSMEL